MKNLPLSGLILLVFIFAITGGYSSAQVFPEEGANLNYRIIGFSFPVKAGCVAYKVEIADGKIFNPRQFQSKVTSPDSKNNRLIAEVPDFGTDYTWCIAYAMYNNKTAKSKLYHFSTLSLPTQNYQEMRLRVTQKNNCNANFYVLADQANIMYDNDGSAIWFLPKLNTLYLPAQDLKYTAQHTITLLLGQEACEINYNGKLLWKAPDSLPLSGRSSTDAGMVTLAYHHEFSRLLNGHYMAICNVFSKHETSGEGKETDNLEKKKNAGVRHFFPKNQGGNILYEFDSTGSVVWSWNSIDYLEHSDIGYFFDDVNRIMHIQLFDCHENSFYFDEKNKVIYLSYSAINRIVKISYPSGEVLDVYGKEYDTVASKSIWRSFDPQAITANDTIAAYLFNNHNFVGQHACKLTKNGDLMLYNNNMSEVGTAPQLLIFREPGKEDKGGLKKLWEFNCPVDSQFKKMQNAGGGCIYEMKDDLFFVTMNAPNGKIFIVNKDRKILWSALLEFKDRQNFWLSSAAYRSSIIDRSDLEQLIWRSEGISTPENMKARYGSICISK